MAKDLKPASDPAPEQTADREPPRATLTMPDDKTLNIGLSGDWDRLFQATGHEDVYNGLLTQIVTVGTKGAKPDEAAANFAVGFLDAMQPKDAAEALLLSQMAVAHQVMMTMAGRLTRVETITQIDCAERAFSKAARTYAAQMDTLKRYRSKGQQVVRVERVTVNEGGQAIVGNIEAGGGGGRGEK